jgi:hypothetical protein
LFQKPLITLEHQAQIRNVMEEHRNSLDTHAKANPLISDGS